MNQCSHSCSVVAFNILNSDILLNLTLYGTNMPSYSYIFHILHIKSANA